MVAEITVPHCPSRAQIEALELEVARMPQAEVPTRHYFADGLYAREIAPKAGTVLTGAVHRYQHINILSQGEITVWTEEGMKRIKAPFTFVSLPGTKRAGYVHADCVWTTIHCNPTGSNKPDDLWLFYVEPVKPELLEARKCLSL